MLSELGNMHIPVQTNSLANVARMRDENIISRNFLMTSPHSFFPPFLLKLFLPTPPLFQYCIIYVQLVFLS